MSLALVVLGISMVLGCPPSNNSTGGGPTLSSSVPANGAMDFSANANIVLTYSEAVLVGTGNITITPSGGAPITIAVGDAQVTIAGAVVTISPTNPLDMDAAYVLTIPAGAFMDAAGNKTAVATVSFSTAPVMAFDTTAPTLVSSNPVEGSTDFSADASITLTYSEPVLAGTGEITLLYSDGTTRTGRIDVTDTTQVSIAGAVVTIATTIPQSTSDPRVLTIPAGAFKDAAGNTTAENTVSFTTAVTLDTTGPMLALLMPADDARDVAVGANIVLTYNEVVQVGTGNITLVASGGATITIAVTDAQVSFAGAVVTINPTNDLAVSTTYTLTVPASAITDASGNAGAEVTVSFSTAAAADTTAPTVTSSVPAQNGTAVVGANIVLTYSENVQRGTGSITITPEGSTAISIPVADTVQVTINGAVVTINPTRDLLPDIRYGVSIPAGALEDLSGNAAAVHLLTFNTTSKSIPSVSSSVPSSGAEIDNTANIVLTYSEAVQAATGNITITPESGSPITIAVGDAQVTIAGNVVTINSTDDLVVNTTYTLTVPANAFESSDDQTDAGVFTLPFSTAATADTTAPSVSSSVPAAGGTIQATDNIVLTYSETVVKGSGSITLVPSGGATTMIPISVAQVSVAVNVVTINPTTNLLAGTTYVLTVPAGGFVDLAGNTSADYTLSFSTEVAGDRTVPTVLSTDPVNGAISVALDSDIVFTYSETVQAGTGNITITPTGGGATITIAVTDATQVSIASAVVTIDPTADLVEPNTMYTVSIPAGAIRDNAVTPNATTTTGTLSFTTRSSTRTVVLWVGVNQVSSLNGFSTDALSCPDRLKPNVATGTVTRRFLATGTGSNQNPGNFTVDNTGGGAQLSAYTGSTSVFAANSTTTVLTDNDKVADSYFDLVSPGTNLLRTFNQAGLNGEDERGSISGNRFWTGINNLPGANGGAGGYEAARACIDSGNFWSTAAVANRNLGHVGTSFTTVKAVDDGVTAPSDVFATLDGCEESLNVLCMTY